MDTRLTGAITQRGYLAVLAPLRHVAQARRALLARYRLTEVNVTALLLAGLRGLGHPWEVIVAADTGKPADPDFDALAQLVQHDRVEQFEDWYPRRDYALTLRPDELSDVERNVLAGASSASDIDLSL